MQKALRLAADTHALEDIIEALKRGEMQAFHNDRAIVITEIAQSPRRKFVHVFMSAGDLDGVLELMPQIEEWGKSLGAEFARASVRPGYEPILKARGWKKTMVVFEYHPKGADNGRQ
jgi:hypothetical protein